DVRLTITNILPNADENGTWTRNPASGGRFDKLNDASDTTYITSPATGSLTYQGIQFGTLTVTGTQRINAIRANMQYKFVTAGYVELRVIRSGETNSQAVIVQQSATVTAGGNVSSAWLLNDPSGAEWVQGSLDSFTMRLY